MAYTSPRYVGSLERSGPAAAKPITPSTSSSAIISTRAAPPVAAECSPLIRTPRGRQAGQIFVRDETPVDGAPRLDVHARNRVHVVGRGRADSHAGTRPITPPDSRRRRPPRCP